MRLRSITPCALLALAACRPSDFDDAGRWRRDDDAVEVPPEAGTDAALPPDDARDAGAPPRDAGSADDGGCAPAPAGGRALAVRAGPTELARLTTPAGVVTRLAGPSGMVGGRRVWTFSTTRLAQPLPSDVPGNLPSSALTGADAPWSRPLSPRAPWTLQEILAPEGTPRSFLRLHDGEDAATNLAVASFVSAAGDASRGLLFVLQSRLLSAPSAVWLADLSAPAAPAERRARPLFVPPTPMFAHAALRTPTDLKVYACVRPDDAYGARCVVARAPLDRSDDAAAYEVYGRDAAGKLGWLSDLTRGEPVLDDVSEDLSVSWNAHLGRFLAVSSVPLQSAVRLRAASAMEGPWSAPVDVPLPLSRVYVPLRAREQPGLAQDCERRVVISYWSPTSAPDPESLPNEGEVVLAAIDLE